MTTLRRHWFAFSLRTLFVVVTVLGVSLGWVGYQLSWIKRRHASLVWSPVFVSTRGTKKAPIPLRFFGEKGAVEVVTWYEKDAPEIAALKALFPEAEVYHQGAWPELARDDDIPEPSEP